METGRYRIPKVTLDQRLRRIYSNNCIEDEFHFSTRVDHENSYFSLHDIYTSFMHFNIHCPSMQQHCKCVYKNIVSVSFSIIIFTSTLLFFTLSSNSHLLLSPFIVHCQTNKKLMCRWINVLVLCLGEGQGCLRHPWPAPPPRSFGWCARRAASPTQGRTAT